MAMLVSLLLLTPADDLAEIISVMRLREQATTRYRVAFEVRQTSRGRTGPEGTYDATFACSDNTLMWRANWSVGTNTERRSQERIVLAGPERATRLRRVAGGGWRGNLRRADDLHLRLRPAHFGLRRSGRDYSENLLGASTRVLGRERVGAFDCVRVLYDPIGTDPVSRPVLAWLSVDHGYVPVRTILFYRPERPLSDPADREAAQRESLAWVRGDGAFFEARSVVNVEAMMQVDGGWLPLRGCWKTLRWERGASGEITLDVVRESVRSGSDIGPPDFALDDVESVLVRDQLGGGGHHRVTGKELQAIVLEGAEFGFWSRVLGLFFAYPKAMVFYFGLLVFVGMVVVYGLRRLVSLRGARHPRRT